MAQAATGTVRAIKRDTPFAWEGKDKRGARVKGKSLAPDEQTLRAELRRQGVAPSRIRKQRQSHAGGRVNAGDIAVFSRQLSTMLAAGIPLVQGFEIVGAGNDKASMQRLILDIKAEVQGGTSLHEALANRILEVGLESGFDLALSWEAPVDHAFLSPVNTMHGTRPIPPLVPIWVNCFVAPQPTARRCFAFGQHIARVVAASPWSAGIIATGGLSHFPELSLPRVGETDTVFDRKLIHWMEKGEHEPLLELTVGELHKSGEHEFLNWMVLIGAVTPARADVRYFGELPRINLAAVEWRL